MRRRFGRRRWGGGGEGNGEGPRGLDAARELARAIQSGVVPADALEPVTGDDVPSSLAAVGTGTSRDGERLVVGVSPGSGGDAWLAALAVAARLAAEEGFDGGVYAVSGSWSLAARRRLGLQRPGRLVVRARMEPDAQDAAGEVVAEGLEAPVVAAAALPAELPEAARSLWRRAATALAGLGAKHGGAVRPAAAGVELVFAGRPVALLRGDGSGVGLEAYEPRRELQRLAPDALADAFDRFEGGLRKVLSDRRLREGEPALRMRLAAALAETAGVRAVAPWPLAGPLGEGVDFAGIDGDGRAVVGAVRSELGLLALGAALDGWIELAPRIATLLPEAPAPRTGPPLLLLAAERFDPAAERVLAQLDLAVRVWDAEGTARGAPVLTPHAPAARAAATSARPSAAPARPPAPRPAAEERPAPLALAEPARAVEAPAAPEGEPGEAAPRRRFEEVSLFDLAAEGDEGGDRGGARRRRRRRRGRGRGRTGAEAALPSDEEERDDDDEAEPAAVPRDDDELADAPAESRDERGGRRRRRRGGRGRDRDRDGERRRAERPRAAAPRDAEPDGDDEEDLEDEELMALAEVPDVPEVEESVEPAFEEEEEEEEESPEDARLRQEREARRRARIAKVEPEPTAPARPPRRRAAFLAHADRESIGAAVLLARETRLVEGIWIYPQADLMTFFRGVATDLRDDTPICVIGFAASPARDTLQAAALYRDRLTWFDHHRWPPEDVEGLRAAIGGEAVHVDPDAGSVLPLVLSTCARRSRFSDKLVDLLTGRFSRHDWERWGRLWWWRLGQLAGKTGERRGDLEALVGGRPSDLAREASRAADPPLPVEAEWAASRDFRLVHFGGYALVRVPVPPELDLHLAARIVRERYAAAVSVAWTEGGDRFVLGSDESSVRRALDLGAMVDHLAEKFAWVQPLADADHVARFRIEEAAQRPERIDEVVAEIAMGRSLLEG